MSENLLVPRIGLFIIGDEILSGRRQDSHLNTLIALLAERGLQLSWVRMLPDEPAELVEALQWSFARGDIVFSCGGIGATPDDHTRQAAADALGLPLALHPEARRLINERQVELAARDGKPVDLDGPENQQRLKMGEFPAGADIVPNPFNKIPGFWIADHTFLPGFPVMAGPMMAWTLDERYAALHHRTPRAEYSFLVFDLPESVLSPVMETLERQWSGVRAFSLPTVGKDGSRGHIDLGVKGEPTQCVQALAFLKAEVKRLGGHFTVQ
ncbi:MAG: molybdopterin-binding protein [Pigmentiphaga sp.]|nr:molybdopterin-binding protein [Pigmentiphaga sp.]